MVRIVVRDGQLVIELQGWDRVWAFKRGMTVPLTHVRGATADPGANRDGVGRRGPGLHVPRVATVGTFHRDQDRIFRDIHDGANAIVIELVDEPYARLIVEVAEPRSTVDEINRAARASG